MLLAFGMKGYLENKLRLWPLQIFLSVLCAIAVIGGCNHRMIDDSELLKRYVEERSEAAFAELVQRQAGLVYSAALRQVGGDMMLAQDVCQSVFIDLARKARMVSSRPVLASWLYVSTRFAALKAMRSKRRREAREQEAYFMKDIEASSAPPVEWNQLRPLLDSAICELPERDRAVVLMRYFEGQPYAAMGQQLGIEESSARVKAERALNKLRIKLAHKGITSTAAALALAITANAVSAAPAGLAATLTGSALAHSAAVGGGLGVLLKVYHFIAVKKIQTCVGSFFAVAATGFASYTVEEPANSHAFLVYAICFGVGLLFALVSAFFGHVGGGHFDTGHGPGGHSGGSHGHAEGGTGLHDMPGFAAIGPTTIATFVTAFGALGMILCRLEATHRYSGLIAVAGALTIATLVGWFFSVIFRHTQSSSEGQVAALIGQSATVITPIPISGVGEIAYVQGGTRYSAPARTEDGKTVASGATVWIVRIVGTQFYVSSE